MMDARNKTLAYHPFQKILDYFPDLEDQTPVKVDLWDDDYTCDVFWDDGEGNLTLTTASYTFVSRSSSVYMWE
jgi:hypothetical protein